MKRCVWFVICALALTGMVHAQGVTTGSLSGVVNDPNNELMPGVTVVATLTTTGNTYSAVTDGAGRFRIANVKVGGPYEVTATLDGFQTQTLTDIYVRLGETTHMIMALQLEAATGEIVVVGAAGELINPTKMGVGSSVNQNTLESMPTVERNLYDFARTNPVFSTYSPDEDATVLSVSGRNPRYNNISIDGAVNNDVFGLADSGTPGGQTETQPIQLDAVQELQLVTSSFDVRQGGFTGGSVNVITKSGTNDFHGTVYGYTSSDSWVGSGPDYFNDFGDFDDTEYGFTLGGPIKKDKAFFFVGWGHNEYDRPTGWSLDGVTGQQWGGGTDFSAEAEEFRQYTIATYGYDPGGLSEQTRETPSDKILLKLDYNANDSNNLVFRYNYVDASNLINRPGYSLYEWDSEAYDMTNETNSFVAQWNAIFGDSYFNELRVTYQTIRDNRGGVTEPFPHITIENVDGQYNGWDAGTENYSTYNALDTDIIEITNDFTFFAGDHEIVIGTHNEIYSFKNLFIQNGFGSYEFETLDDYYAGEAGQFDYSFANDPANPADEFDTFQIGIYAGDTWRAKSNFTLTYGLRVDIPFFPDEPGYNPLADDLYGVDTSNVPDGNPLWSPRVGFNWDIANDGTKQLRGGVGLFTGRTPYVWISNNYGRTGLTQTTIRAYDVMFNPDPFDQPSDIGGASTQEINAVDPDFEFPQTWRANLAYDHRLPWWNLVATGEVIYAQSANEIDYKNLNLVQNGNAFDGRPYYQPVSSDFSGAYYLTNTSDGDATNVIVKLEKAYGNSPFWGSLSYTWGESNVVNEGTSSRAVSNWRYMETTDPNNQAISTSDFQVEHRLMAVLNYEFNRDSRWSTMVSMIFNRQSGKPYSTLMSSDRNATPDYYASINGDDYGYNDLLYIPSGPDQVELQGGTWDQFTAYLDKYGLTKYMGKVVPRNATNQPWVTQTDLAIRQNIPIPGKSSLQVSLDIFNFWNLIDDESGLVRYVNFGNVTPLRYMGQNDDDLPIYQLWDLVTNPDEDIFYYNDLKSRWRMRLGVRWTF
ncbi:MAG: carboxypeptidase regulatory-like domain-containing protein [Thermoanaerobaculales bacterium]|jgi:hypothetical protein|nr:carboxypeptidase regulatory-like domain-containing protein [Thermoanaerobaculales bacterium]